MPAVVEPEEQDRPEPEETLPDPVTDCGAMKVRKDHKPACNEITHEIRAAMSKWIKFCQYCGQKLNSKETL